jgi:LPXTG-motif cell wall-anchored protein
MMMRKLVVFLVLLSTVFASCDEYVTSAVNDFGTSCVYPQCFGAAGRYKEAAFCYWGEGDVSTARIYFQKAADYYLQGISYVGPAGDYPLRAPSYEYAGDMKAELGNYAVAAKYYDAAISEYLKIDNIAKANEVKAKKAALGQPTVAPTTGEATVSQSLLLAGFFFLVAVVALALFFWRRRSPPKEDFTPIVSEPTRPPEEPKESVESPKEKMREKIRKKYGLE